MTKNKRGSEFEGGFCCINIPSESTTHLVCLMLIHVLRSGFGVRLDVQVPAVQLHDVAVLHVREDLCDGFICVALQEEVSRWSHGHKDASFILTRAESGSRCSFKSRVQTERSAQRFEVPRR